METPTLSLADLVKNMVSDVKTGKVKTTRKKKPKMAATRPKHESIRNPWIDEAITLLLNEYHCDCGSVHTFPNPLIFIERTRIRHGHPEVHQEAVPVSNIYHAYSHLPRRTETHQHEVHNCQDCFTPDANPFCNNQIPFNFTQELH